MADRKNIEELFRDRLQNAEVTPPPGVWDAIEQELGGTPTPAHADAGISRSGWASMAIIALLGIAGYVTWLATPSQNNLEPLVAEETRTENPEVVSDLTETLTPAQESGLELSESIPAMSGSHENRSASGSIESASILPPLQASQNSDDEGETAGTDQIAANSQSSTSSNPGIDAGLSFPEAFTPTAGRTIQPLASTDDSDVDSNLPVLNHDGGIQSTEVTHEAVSFLPAALDVSQTISDRDPVADDLAASRSWNSGVIGGFYAGAAASLIHTSLLSESAVQSDINLDPVSRIGASWGFTFGYNFNDRLALETGLVVDSRQGSNYNSVVEVNTETMDVTKRIQLVYSQIPLTVRYRHNNAFANGGAGQLNYVAGIQYGYLRNSRLAVDDRAVSPDRDLQKHDFAFLFGLDYDMKLSSHLFMTLGARAAISANQTRVVDLQDINQDKRNALFGLRAALNYSLGDL